MDRESWLIIEGLIDQCRIKIGEIDSVTREILGANAVFFKPLSLRVPDQGCAELVFLRSIFWLQSLFHECGNRPIRFCHRQSQFQDREQQGQLYLNELRALRTHAAHNLDSASETDKLTEFTCIQWYKRSCRKCPPMGDTEWATCTEALFKGAIATLENINAFLLLTKASQDSDLMIEEFRSSVSCQISPYAFDEIVSSVADDLGRLHLNLIKFRSDYLSKWVAGLERLKDGYDFQREARLLIEQSFLENPERPPVSGQDIIKELGVSKGPEVGRLLAIAKQLFENGCTEKKLILEELRSQLQK